MCAPKCNFSLFSIISACMPRHINKAQRLRFLQSLFRIRTRDKLSWEWQGEGNRGRGTHFIIVKGARNRVIATKKLHEKGVRATNESMSGLCVLEYQNYAPLNTISHYILLLFRHVCNECGLCLTFGSNESRTKKEMKKKKRKKGAVAEITLRSNTQTAFISIPVTMEVEPKGIRGMDWINEPG